MPAQKNQQVTVRCLPDGNIQGALLHGLNGNLLQIDARPDSPALNFEVGDLVEVNCPDTLYLGEVRVLHGATLVVGVEHALDRAALGLIQQVWHGPAGD